MASRNGLPTKWVWILDPVSLKQHPIQVIVDRCADANFICSQLVGQLHLDCFSHKGEFKWINDAIFTTEKRAEVTWMGKGNKTGLCNLDVLESETLRGKIVMGMPYLDDENGGEKFLLDEAPVQPAPVCITLSSKKKNQPVS